MPANLTSSFARWRPDPAAAPTPTRS